jgi:hypothetical protein
MGYVEFWVYTKDWGKACFVVLGMEVIRTVR